MISRRGILIHPEELDHTWLDEIEKTNINVLGLHPVGGFRAPRSLAAAVERHRTPEFQALLQRARSMGLIIEYEAHALRYLVPSHLYEQHPDWFRMNAEGQRVPDYNICPSCEAALKYLTERTAELTAALDTGSNRFYWWADDVEGNACCCEKCRNLSASDQLMIITNAIHRGVRKVKPDGMTAYLAYHDAMLPPTQVQPDEGIFVEYAPIHRKPHRPINDPECAENAAEVRPLQALLDYFGTAHAQVLEYWMDNSLFSNWTKPPKAMTLDSDVMREDVAFYRSMGFDSITSFGCYLGADYRALHGQPPVAEYGAILCTNE